jgi:hypothetical protein
MAAHVWYLIFFFKTWQKLPTPQKKKKEKYGSFQTKWIVIHCKRTKKKVRAHPKQIIWDRSFQKMSLDNFPIVGKASDRPHSNIKKSCLA